MVLSVRRIKLLSFALVVSLLISCVSGCGEDKKKNFVMRTSSTLGAEADAVSYSEILSEYSKSHKNVVINDTSTTRSGSYKMELSIASTYRGAGTPDVIYYSAIDDMSELSDFFMTVDEIRKDYPKFASQISEAAINSAAASDGGRYCIPVRGEWRGIVINAALFRRSSLKIPEKWEDIIRAAKHFEKNQKVSLFANSLEESGALIEYMVRGLGGTDSLYSAMKGSPDSNWNTVLEAIEELDGLNAFPKMSKSAFDSLVSPSDLKHTSATKQPSPVELYNSRKAAILLMDNTMCGQIDADIDSNYIALPEVGTVTQSETTTEFSSYPSHALSGPVYPPFTANTLPDETTTTTTKTVRHSPEPTQKKNEAVSGSDTPTGETENGLYVSFTEGFYITKKAYYDKGKREDILDFVEFFLKEENAVKLCNRYQAPSLCKLSKKTRDGLTNKSNIYNGVIKAVENANSFVVTTQTQENSFFWEHCSLAVGCMSKGILTKREALGMIADTQLTIKDIYGKR
jgi:ABC-type sugar transport system, periplasmic component